MKKKLIFKALITILLLMLVFTGCTSNDSGEVSPEGETDTVSDVFVGDKIVDIEYVKANMNNDNFMAIDARGPEAITKSGSLENATGVIWQQLSTVADGKSGDANWGVVLDKERLSSALSEIGITRDKDIVVFADTQKGWGDDGRILWTLTLAGYDNVKILDGGILAIENAGLNTSKEPAPYVPAQVTIDNMDLTSSIDTDELESLIADDSVKIIDTRDISEYDGAANYGENAGGHIPGSISINFLELVKEDGTLKSNADIDAIMSANGIAKDDSIVTYCTAGIRSAYMQQILEMNGYTNVRNYDESYYRWSEINEVE
ncbi:sulfurtransferase [Proteocatella sphenisci]|uniref:sulfurtransferase n=1 Tax=Proteocatella sphenisci TaxID=181070 RepID=UPI00048DFBE1|nr:rhodanese-like domain-containing protein [Proteocatella sphenisci]